MLWLSPRRYRLVKSIKQLMAYLTATPSSGPFTPTHCSYTCTSTLFRAFPHTAPIPVPARYSAQTVKLNMTFCDILYPPFPSIFSIATVPL
ncbi:hypothetical protein Y032_0938g3122 [Ancylostoma ceylanicum]|uniref:Uncharacterized protein n=1 Tax=Ancylostoma ceylanicum TaxID=53326 RepID=A0A016W9Z7_9BILA|nr:hypothetical protein Y032_0938g3122 [Ancylostoma ceylanicum]